MENLGETSEEEEKTISEEEKKTENEENIISEEEKKTENEENIINEEEKKTENEENIISEEEKKIENEEKIIIEEEKKTENEENIISEEEKKFDKEEKIIEDEERLEKKTEYQETQVKKRKPNKKIIVAVAIICIVLVAGAVGAFLIRKNNQEKERVAEEERIRIEKQEKEYHDKISETLAYMLTNTSGCASYVSAYLELLSDYSYMGSSIIKDTMYANSEELRNKLDNNDSIVVENIKWLSNNKIDKYKEVYDVLLDMYDNYRVFYDDSIELSLSTISAAETLLDKGQTVLEKYNRILVIMPNLKDEVENQEENIGDKF